MNKILKMFLLLIVYGIISYGIFRIAKNLITKIPKTVDPISCTDSQKLNEKGDCVPVCDDNKIINDKINMPPARKWAFPKDSCSTWS